MLNCVVNSEKEYLQLIRDCITIGVRVVNPNAEGDSDDQSVSDSFETLSPEVARDYLGYVIDKTSWFFIDGKYHSVDNSLLGKMSEEQRVFYFKNIDIFMRYA